MLQYVLTFESLGLAYIIEVFKIRAVPTNNKHRDSVKQPREKTSQDSI